MNRHKLIVKKENKIKKTMLIVCYKFGNPDSAAAARQKMLSIYLSESENRVRHGLGKVYRNPLYSQRLQTFVIRTQRGCNLIFQRMYIDPLLNMLRAVECTVEYTCVHAAL